jgi:hypothetical protein
MSPKARVSRAKNQTANQIFKEIVGLRVGEALLFSPRAMIGADVASVPEGQGKKQDHNRWRQERSGYVELG